MVKKQSNSCPSSCPADEKVSAPGEITCPTCGNKITDNTLLRCPRCFSSLLKMGCEGCAGCGSGKGKH